MAAVQTIKKLPAIKEDVNAMKARIQELEREVFSYKSRLDELRKAKNNLIIKKSTEYVNTKIPVIQKDRRLSKTPSPEEHRLSLPQIVTNVNNDEQRENLERVVDNLTMELNESKDLIAALRLENEEVKSLLVKTKNDYQIELAEAYSKYEESKKEIKQWEVMYKEWMRMMEDRVSNINRTHQLLQQCMSPNQDLNPPN